MRWSREKSPHVKAVRRYLIARPVLDPAGIRKTACLRPERVHRYLDVVMRRTDPVVSEKRHSEMKKPYMYSDYLLMEGSWEPWPEFVFPDTAKKKGFPYWPDMPQKAAYSRYSGLPWIESPSVAGMFAKDVFGGADLANRGGGLPLISGTEPSGWSQPMPGACGRAIVGIIIDMQSSFCWGGPLVHYSIEVYGCSEVISVRKQHVVGDVDLGGQPWGTCDPVDISGPDPGYIDAPDDADCGRFLAQVWKTGPSDGVVYDFGCVRVAAGSRYYRINLDICFQAGSFDFEDVRFDLSPGTIGMRRDDGCVVKVSAFAHSIIAYDGQGSGRTCAVYAHRSDGAVMLAQPETSTSSYPRWGRNIDMSSIGGDPQSYDGWNPSRGWESMEYTDNYPAQWLYP